LSLGLFLGEGLLVAKIDERLAAAKAAGGNFAVFVLDLDKFKSINDSFNHETGDAALLQFSQVMVQLVGERGVVCRMGGDEFEIGLDDTDGDAAHRFAYDVQQALRRALQQSVAKVRPVFTVSIGIACYPGEGDEIDVLSHRADEAMYAAKAAGSDAIRSWRQLDASRAA